mmetsp:Transcript_42789/g.52016  ORF Transcript_42789/g.52016 Transcript_42789/m.52016 type:complete len:149 (-) Transcript_42789:337-783(-)
MIGILFRLPMQCILFELSTFIRYRCPCLFNSSFHNVLSDKKNNLIYSFFTWVFIFDYSAQTLLTLSIIRQNVTVTLNKSHISCLIVFLLLFETVILSDPLMVTASSLMRTQLLAHEILLILNRSLHMSYVIHNDKLHIGIIMTRFELT